MAKSKTQSVDELSKDKKNKADGKAINKKALRVVGAILISIVLLFTLLLGLSFGYEKVYQNQIFPGVEMASIDLTGKTKDEAKVVVENKIKNIGNTEIKIKYGENEKTIKLSDLPVTINVNESIDEVYNYGRDGNFLQNAKNQLVALYQTKNFNYVVDANDELKSKLEEIVPGFNKEAKNARIAINNNIVEIENEEQGSKIDLVKFNSDLSEQLSRANSKSVILGTIIEEPEIQSKQLEDLLPQINLVLNNNIKFVDTEKNKTYEASKEEIANWINFKKDETGQVSIELSDDSIKNFIQEDLAKNINKKTIDKKINAQTKAVISEGQDGRELNEGNTLKSIQNILNGRLDNQAINNQINLEISIKERQEKEIQPEEISINGGTPGLAEGKYIEVNLSQQMLYIYNGTSQEGAFRVSTGKWSMPTPIGTRYIQDKDPYAWSAKYELYMPYWNGIGGGYGIHELPEWPGGAKEGEAHLGTPVSHGCISLGVGAAATVYNWASVGTPVFIHK